MCGGQVSYISQTATTRISFWENKSILFSIFCRKMVPKSLVQTVDPPFLALWLGKYTHHSSPETPNKCFSHLRILSYLYMHGILPKNNSVKPMIRCDKGNASFYDDFLIKQYTTCEMHFWWSISKMAVNILYINTESYRKGSYSLKRSTRS